jgi:hypothetical protein
MPRPIPNLRRDPGSMRFLGIDHGTRRIGLSYGDDIGVATPLPAITTEDPRKAVVRSGGSILKERRITDVVVGHPLNMDGTSGPKAKEVEEFARGSGPSSGCRCTSWTSGSPATRRSRR